jgi:uncharacterized membrane protein
LTSLGKTRDFQRVTWTKSRTSSGISDQIGLAVLYAIAVVSIVGFELFRLWPQLLVTLPGAMAAYPRAFAVLPRAQILVAFAVLAIALFRSARWRWLPAFIAIYAISLSSELLGTTIGLPFGPYAYTSALGAKWFGHVPALIPVSWFMMAVPSFALARTHGSRPTSAADLRRIALGSFVLLAWDLSLDPAMSSATAFWVWGSKGPYYGMPWLNLFGWFATGAVLMFALDRLDAAAWIDALPRRWLGAYYGANLALPLGLAAAAGMWWALAASAAAFAVCWMLARGRVTARAFA